METMKYLTCVNKKILREREEEEKMRRSERRRESRDEETNVAKYEMREEKLGKLEKGE